jgi:hypothetical protein
VFTLQPIIVFLDTAFISDFMHCVQSLLKPKGTTALAPPKPAGVENSKLATFRWMTG